MALILNYARPSSQRGRWAEALCTAIGLMLTTAGMIVFLGSVAELRIGCHEAINWTLEGNHGNGFGAGYFATAACGLIGSAILLLLAWIANPEVFGPRAKPPAGSDASNGVERR